MELDYWIWDVLPSNLLPFEFVNFVFPQWITVMCLEIEV